MELAHTIYEPAGDGPHPAIFALHGWGANALDLLGLAPHLCGGRFLVICPQGPVEVPLAPGNVGYGWFPLRLDDLREIDPLLSARDALLPSIDSCFDRYPVDPKKAVVLGFSQGGVMASALALARPERFAAIVSLSSWLPKELADHDSRTLAGLATGSRPFALVHHGSSDELLPVERGRESVETLRRLGYPVTYREYDMGHQITSRSLGDLSAWLEEKVLSPIVPAR
jgi:phospholipase/carboxylesterase